MLDALLSNGNKSTNGRSFYRRLAPLRWSFRRLGALAPRTTGRIALRLFRTPHPHSTPPREQRWLNSADRFDFRFRRETFAAWSWGTGPTVLLVHGWEGRGSQMGAFAQPLVDAGYRVVAFDGPAHGDSTGRLASLPQFAEAIQVVADQIGPLHGAVTHSFGSPAIAWAMQTGLKLKRLVFVSPPADLNEYVDYFCHVLGFSDRVRGHMIDHLQSKFDLEWNEASRVTLVPQTDTELLVIHDRNDTDSALTNGQSVAASWSSARLMVTSGLGHRRILRDQQVVAEAVRFLDRDVERVAEPVGPAALPHSTQRRAYPGAALTATLAQDVHA